MVEGGGNELKGVFGSCRKVAGGGVKVAGFWREVDREDVLSESDESSSSAEETIDEKRVDKANQQNKDFANQNKDLQDKYDVLINQVNTFEEKNNEFHEQIKVLNKNNADLLAQTKVLKDQLQVKHVVIDTHVECHEKYAKLEEERYEYMIRYSALFDNDKHHRKQIANQEILFDKMSVELMCDLLDDNNFFIFDDESVRIPPVSKMPFRKKPCDSMIVRSKNCPDLSLDPRFGMFKAYDG
nr:hypothetical protein [Tanacetum cinerariifolium]